MPVRIKHIAIALVFLALASLAVAGVKVDYDTGIDFSRYGSFGWLEGTPAPSECSFGEEAGKRSSGP